MNNYDPFEIEEAKPRFSLLKFILIAILLIAAAVTALMIYTGSWRIVLGIYNASKSDTFAADCVINASYGNMSFSAEGRLSRISDSEGAHYLRADTEDGTIFFSNGVIIKENGTSYTIGSYVLSNIDIGIKDIIGLAYVTGFSTTYDADTYTYSVYLKNPELLNSNLPDSLRSICLTSFRADIVLKNNYPAAIRMTVEGCNAVSGMQFSLDVDISRDYIIERLSVPSAVKDSAQRGTAGARASISEAVSDLSAVIYNYLDSDYFSADAQLTISWGKINVPNDMTLYYVNTSSTPVFCFEYMGNRTYFNNKGIVYSNGNVDISSYTVNLDDATILPALLMLCFKTDVSRTTDEDTVSYSFSITPDDASLIINYLYPDFNKMEAEFSETSINLELSGHTLISASLECSGSVKVILLRTDASVALKASMTDKCCEIPAAVYSALSYTGDNK